MGYYAGPKATHICSHVRSDLRGCNRLANHDGPHYNIFAPAGETWTDADGMYCETHADWCKTVEKLGRSK